MFITAALLGAGIFILFFDMPKRVQGVALENMWLPHIAVFVILVAIHGGSAEGTVVAGIATLVFRWFLHRLANKRNGGGRRSALTPEEKKDLELQYATIVEQNDALAMRICYTAGAIILIIGLLKVKL